MPDERKRYGLSHEHVDAELTLQAELAQVKAERDAARERIARLEGLVRDCQDDLARWIVPDSGISDDEVLNALLGRLDGPQSRDALSPSTPKEPT